jgi:hypothetical protein
MKKVLMTTIAATVAMAFVVPANANTAKHKVSASIQAQCKEQAAKKFSAIHFLKRRDFTNNCMARHANAKAKPAAKPVAEAPAAKPTTTGQAPKQ